MLDSPLLPQKELLAARTRVAHFSTSIISALSEITAAQANRKHCVFCVFVSSNQLKAGNSRDVPKRVLGNTNNKFKCSRPRCMIGLTIRTAGKSPTTTPTFNYYRPSTKRHGFSVRQGAKGTRCPEEPGKGLAKGSQLACEHQ